MKLTRRGVFGLLAGAVLDPDMLIWKPGKLISIPAPARYFKVFFLGSPVGFVRDSDMKMAMRIYQPNHDFESSSTCWTTVNSIPKGGLK